MPPKEAAEDMLANATAEGLDSATFEKQQLQNRKNTLEHRAAMLIQRLETARLELGSANDRDMPLRKSDEEQRKAEIKSISERLGSIWGKKNGIAETNTALNAVEKKIESLEALFPGNEERN